MAESTKKYEYDENEQREWQKKHDNLKDEVEKAKKPYVEAKEKASKALNELNSKEAEVNQWQNTLNELVKQGAPEFEIQKAKNKRDAAQAQIKGLQNTYKTEANNERTAEKEYNNKKSELEKLAKKEPKKIAEAKQKAADEKAAKKEAKQQQKNANAKAKIQSMLSKIADPTQNIHKTVCLKAGILPSTPYAIKFCEWLQSHTEIDETTGECDWYTIDEKNNTDIDGKVLKVYKKDWILERSGATEDSDDDNSAGSVTDTADAEAEAADKQLAEANTNKEKLDATQNKINTLQQNISNVEQEIKNLKSTKKQITGSSHANDPKYANLDSDIAQLEEKLTNYKSELKTTKDTLSDIKKAADTDAKNERKEAKAAEKNAAKEAAEKEKAIKWWSSTIKKWRQDYLNDMHKKYGSDKIKVIPDEVSKDEMQMIGKYAAENPTMTNNMSWTQLAKGDNQKTIDAICKRIWNNQDRILSIKNDMPAEVQKVVEEQGQAMTPDAAAACFMGGVSNTFALAKQGLEIAHDPDILMQRALVLENASMAAVAKLTNRTAIEVANAMKSILDLTPITSIPMDAAKEMLKLIPTPADIMKKLDDAMKLDAKMEESANNSLNEELDKNQNMINEKASGINKNVSDKLKAFNEVTSGILNVLNQGPDWYIDNLNTVERKFEKEIVKGIQDATMPILDYKFQFRDAMVAQVAYNLVAPVAEVLEKAQIVILRKVVELKNKAIAKAKALAAKAIMKILGLLGA